jgi:hypothetical protein
MPDGRHTAWNHILSVNCKNSITEHTHTNSITEHTHTSCFSVIE